MARAGWSYLSDDELLLSRDNDEVEARGFRSFFALANSKGPTKNCFEPADTFTAPRVDRCAPRFVFFTKISGAPETQLQALTQPETMSRLIRACPWATYDIAIAASNLELLSRLARQARGFDLWPERTCSNQIALPKLSAPPAAHEDKWKLPATSVTTMVHSV